MQEKLEMSKTSTEENFPVGSFLLPKKLRPHIMAYYNFARTADDIADNHELSPENKLKRLDDMEKVLLGQEKPTKLTQSAEKLRTSLKETDITPRHATDLLIAFRQDATGYTYESWADLMNYCKYSAAPVGRYMLDLHKENASTYWPADMLCSVLQILNHLQDCQKDLKEMGRAYIPLNILKNEGLSYDDLLKTETSEKLRKVFDFILDMTEGLLRESATLPSIILHRGLRMEVITIQNLAKALLSRLREQDFLAKRVELSKKDWLFATVSGIMEGICRKKFTLPTN